MTTHRPFPWWRLFVAAALLAALLGLVCIAYAYYYTGHFVDANLPVPDYIGWASWAGVALSILGGLAVAAMSAARWRSLPAS